MYYKPGDPFYTLEHDQHTVGMVYCSRHSKGGHLENLAVDPECRGQGLGGLLVETLVRDNPGVITLTTRIPKYFEQFGFIATSVLDDGANFMFLTNFESQSTSSLILDQEKNTNQFTPTELTEGHGK